MCLSDFQLPIAHGSISSSVCIERGQDGKLVILKKIRTKKAAANEIDVLSLFSQDNDVHPFLVKMYSATVTEVESLVRLEICEQGDLFEYTQRHTLSVATIKLCLMEVGLAIDYLHTNLGVIHEDLKPENIGIARDGHIRLLDFGISTRVDLDTSCPMEALSTQGTVEYASPEKLWRRSHGFETDWWSFGVIAFELLFEDMPWKGESSDEIAQSICTRPIELYEMDDSSSLEDLETLNLVHSLLTLEKQNRLGHEGGFDAISRHAFFRSVNVSDVKSLKCPPFPLQ